MLKACIYAAAATLAVIQPAEKAQDAYSYDGGVKGSDVQQFDDRDYGSVSPDQDYGPNTGSYDYGPVYPDGEKR